MDSNAERTTRTPASAGHFPSPLYAWWVVAVLTVTYLFSFLDRQILNLLVEPIKQDLAISDTEMSLLMGLSFALFYTLFGIPLGRLADRRSRCGLIAAGLVLWSLMTAGCGLARRYGELLLFRMGVGVGEAALSPAAYSMIADYFPPRRLATAISVYSMGIYLGSGLALFLGGVVIRFVGGHDAIALPVVGATKPWQFVFYVIGLGGVLPLLLLLTVREPARGGVGAGRNIPISEVLGYLKQNRRTVLCHHIGFALLVFSSYGSGAWIPAFLGRTHGLDASTAGIVYGLVVMVAGSAGMVIGGWCADWLALRGYRDARLRLGLIAALAWLPTGLAYPLVPTGGLAIALLVPTIFLTSMPLGAAAAAIQELMPNAMRAQASAVYLFVINLIGLGLGPTAVALLTDEVFADVNMLWASLVVVNLAAHLGSAFALWLGLKPYVKSLERLRV